MDTDPTKRPGGAAGEWFTPVRFALLLLVFLTAAFPKVVFGFHSFYYRDYGVIGYPVIFYHRECFWRGEWPLWNPYSNCGVPFLAQWGTMTLYPLSLIYLLFPLPWPLSYFCLGHVFLGGMGMYFLARRWTGNSFAAAVAGLAYVFNGVTFSSFIWPNYLVALGWMPFVVLWTERGWREGGRPLLLAVLAGAMQMLAGVPEISLLTWLLIGCLAAREWWLRIAPRGALMARLALVVLLIAGLMAAQLLPFFDLLAHSQRDRSFDSSKWAMPGWGWANLLVPLFHCYRSPQGPFFQAGQGFMSSYYLGAGILVLASWAAWRIRDGRVRVLAALLLSSLVLAIGENNPLYVWLKQAVPGINIARYAVKYVILAAFVTPLLAASAVARMSTTSALSGRRSLLILGSGVLGLMAVITGVAWKFPLPMDQWSATWQNAAGRAGFLIAMVGMVALWHRLQRPRDVLLAQFGFCLLLGGDFATHTPVQNPTIAVDQFAPGLWELNTKVPSEQLRGYRVLISPQAEQLLLINNVQSPEDGFIGKRLSLWSNLNLLENIAKVNGSATLQLREQKQVQSLIYDGTNGPLKELADFLGVAMATTPGRIMDWSAHPSARSLISLGAQPFFLNETNVLHALASAEFDSRRVVYLPPEVAATVGVINKEKARIVSQRLSAHQIHAEVETEGSAVMVVAQSYYRPWRAYVDGRWTPLFRANYAFQSLVVPAGRHRVELVYQDRKFVAGLAVSGVTLLLYLGLWFRKKAHA